MRIEGFRLLFYLEYEMKKKMLIGLVLLMVAYHPCISQAVSKKAVVNSEQKYEIVIQFYENVNGEGISKIMKLFTNSGFTILRLQQFYLPTEMQEIVLNIKGRNSGLLEDIKDQLTAILKILSMSIQKF